MKRFSLLLVGVLGLAGGFGCVDNSPPPPNVMVPAPDNNGAPHDALASKPLPRDESFTQPPPPFDDPPLIGQPMPEQAQFVEAYNRVGRPRITIFMNRTLDGKIIPANGQDPAVVTDHYRMKPGQYDEAGVKALDYQAIENTLADCFSSNNQVTLISPTLVRQRLSADQVKDLEHGQPKAMNDVAAQLNADILIQMEAHPTQQSPDGGMQVRVVAEAMNTKDGESLGRAVVDIPLPLEKTRINRSTRFIARKLMDEMTGYWLTPAPAPATEPAKE